MTFLIRVNIKSGTLVKDAIKVFNQLENCTILDVDEKTENYLKCRLAFPAPQGVSVVIPVLPHIKDLTQVDVDIINMIVQSHNCVDQSKTEIEMREPDVKKKVVKIDEYRLFKKLQTMKNAQGKVFLNRMIN